LPRVKVLYLILLDLHVQVEILMTLMIEIDIQVIENIVAVETVTSKEKDTEREVIVAERVEEGVVAVEKVEAEVTTV
jgi:hypothetical protein